MRHADWSRSLSVPALRRRVSSMVIRKLLLSLTDPSPSNLAHGQNLRPVVDHSSGVIPFARNYTLAAGQRLAPKLLLTRGFCAQRRTERSARCAVRGL